MYRQSMGRRMNTAYHQCFILNTIESQIIPKLYPVFERSAPYPKQQQHQQRKQHHYNQTTFLHEVQSTNNIEGSTLHKRQPGLVSKNIHPASGKEALKYYLHRCWLRFLLNLASTYFKTCLWLDKGNQWLKNMEDNL